jgi:hypothetical protein
MKFKTILAITLAVAITGCSADKAPVVPEKAKTKPSTGSVGKPSAPISMSYKVLTENPMPGQEIEIQVVFSSHIKKDVSANVKTAENLTWVSSEKSWQASFSKSGQYSAVPNLKVVAQEKGIFYIHIMANVMDNGKALYKPFVIPVNVGNVERTLESPGEIIVDENGQAVIVQKVDSDN